MAVQKCHKFGNKLINSPKVLMNLNMYFRQNETFPHLNITIELERKYHSVLLDTFPELVIKLRRQWASKILAKMNYELTMVPVINH